MQKEEQFSRLTNICADVELGLPIPDTKLTNRGFNVSDDEEFSSGIPSFKSQGSLAEWRKSNRASPKVELSNEEVYDDVRRDPTSRQPEVIGKAKTAAEKSKGAEQPSIGEGPVEDKARRGKKQGNKQGAWFGGDSLGGKERAQESNKQEVWFGGDLLGGKEKGREGDKQEGWFGGDSLGGKIQRGKKS